MSATVIKLTPAELERRFERAINKLDDPHDLLNTIGMELETATVQRMDSAKSPDGTSWPALSPLTRAVRGADARPLQDTGDLIGSITHVVSGNVLHVGTPKKYSRIHQHGGVITAKNAAALAIPAGDGNVIFVKSVTIPRRAFLPDEDTGFPREDEELIDDIVAGFVEDAL